MRLRRVVATTTGLAVVATIGIVTGLTGASAAASTQVVKPSALNGWAVGAETDAAGGSASFVQGPGTPVIGDGSLRFQLTSAASGYAAATPMNSVPLSSIDALSYDTYRASVDAGNNLAVALQFNVDHDLSDASNAFQGRIVFEPYNSSPGGVSQNTWQHWDAMAGTWWQSGNPVVGGAAVAKACPQASPCSWADLLAAYPNAGVHSTLGAVVLKAGSNWAGFDGNVDNLTIGISGDSTTYDFEPETDCTTVCYVDAANGSNAFGGDTASSAKKTIQAAINQVDAGGTVRVLPGNYDETAPNSDPTSLGGTYQFGLFFPSSKPGITVMGVTAGDAPITDASDVEATVTTNATNSFGHSGIFVEADDTTIRGIEIGPNTPGNNKTDRSRRRRIHAAGRRHQRADGGAIYLSEFDAPAGPVSSYDIRREPLRRRHPDRHLEWSWQERSGVPVERSSTTCSR